MLVIPAVRQMRERQCQLITGRLCVQSDSAAVRILDLTRDVPDSADRTRA